MGSIPATLDLILLQKPVFLQKKIFKMLPFYAKPIGKRKILKNYSRAGVMYTGPKYRQVTNFLSKQKASALTFFKKKIEFNTTPAFNNFYLLTGLASETGRVIKFNRPAVHTSRALKLPQPKHAILHKFFTQSKAK